jgi:heptaprenyl diphosphate synthase
VTLPLIAALRKDTSGKLRTLCNVQNMRLADFSGIISMVKNLGGIESAKIHAKTFTNRALQEIMKLPSGNSRDVLEQLTNTLLVRSY